jgi:hypothetical protein
MELQNDVAKNSLWRSSTIITPRSGGSNSHHNKGKAPIMQPTSKRDQPIGFKQKIMADTTTLDPMVVKIFFKLWDRGDTLRTLKQTLKGLPSQLPSTITLSENVVHPIRTTTLGIKPRDDC